MKKTTARIIAIILAALMLSSILFQALSFFANAAVAIVNSIYITDKDGDTVTQITNDTDNIYTITFDFLDDAKAWKDDASGIERYGNVSIFNLHPNWKTMGSSILTFTNVGISPTFVGDMVHVRAALTNVQYVSSSNDRWFSINSTIGSDNYKHYVGFDIPEKYFSGTDDPSNPDTPSVPDTPSDPGITDPPSNPYKSDIVVEYAVAKDSAGNQISKVTKDTPPFTLEIVYADLGLRGAVYNTQQYGVMESYLTGAGGFAPQSSARGKLTYLSGTGYRDAPRFCATFSNVTYTGGGGNLSFRAIYSINGWEVSGSGEATLYAVQDESGDGGDDGDIPPPTPYIIVSEYDYGQDQIEAGSTFTMEISFQNTSKSLPVENIRMTVNPVSSGTTEASYLSIASATNTYYYETLGANSTDSQGVDILVKGSATVGSQALSISFTYEYVMDGKRESGETNTVVYIPITQVDRFEVDPLTDYSQYLTVGEEGYAVVSFVNRGKADTYNISGYILNSDGTPGQTEHYGNLKAGEHGSLDFSVMVYEAGEYTGTIVIVYEDESSNEAEVPVTFTIWVEEPWQPPGGDDFPSFENDTFEPVEPSLPVWKIILVAVGGVAIAAPSALYIIKRVKAKGSEDFDEDF